VSILVLWYFFLLSLDTELRGSHAHSVEAYVVVEGL